jgi:plastocyanin
VRFINVSGGPHNITFWQDSIPSGGATALNANIEEHGRQSVWPVPRAAERVLPEVSFANAPKGTYKGYCTPHLTLGMKIAIKVE